MYCKTLIASALLVAAASATNHEVAPAKHEAPVAAEVAAPKHEVAPPAAHAPPAAAPAAWENVKGAKGGMEGKGHESLQVYLVAVGDNNGSLKYFPDTVHAAPGSIVQFQFHPKNHTVTESSFDQPCKAKDASLATPQRPGLRSGFVPVTPQDDVTPVYNVLVNDTEPIWIFCGQGPHCQMGMSMVINPPNNPERTIQKYQEAAAALPPPAGAGAPPAGGPPSPPAGGPPAADSPVAGAGAASPSSGGASGIDSAPPAASPVAGAGAAPDVPAAGAQGSDEPAPATFTGAATKSTTSIMGVGALALGLVALM